MTYTELIIISFEDPIPYIPVLRNCRKLWFAKIHPIWALFIIMGMEVMCKPNCESEPEEDGTYSVVAIYNLKAGERLGVTYLPGFLILLCSSAWT